MPVEAMIGKNYLVGNLARDCIKKLEKMFTLFKVGHESFGSGSDSIHKTKEYAQYSNCKMSVLRAKRI